MVNNKCNGITGEIKKSPPKLANIALFLLTIPHSNTGEERIFSIIGKNKTKFRSNLDNETSLNSIMLIKINKPESFKSCYQWKFSNEQLKKCKAACKEYNRQHSTSQTSNTTSQLLFVISIHYSFETCYVYFF